MSFNGSGVFSINSTGQPVVASTLIQAAVFNAFATDIATGLSTCITKDGQTTVTADLPMNSHKFTGLAAGTLAGHSIRYEQVLSVAGMETFLATPSSANLRAVLTDETGTGAAVFATSPTLVTPVLGTPTSGTLTACTGLPISTGVSGLGANVATFLATPSSANLGSAVTEGRTGTGALVCATSPTLVTPAIGVATGTSLALNGSGNPGQISAVGGGTAATTLATSRSLATAIFQCLNSSGFLTTFGNHNSVNPYVQIVDQSGTAAGDLELNPFGGKVGVGMVPARALDVTGTFGATGAATLGSTLGVTGAATFSSTLGAGATTVTSLTASLSVTCQSSGSGLIQIGYDSRGSVTQLTSKATAVTCNGQVGRITLNGAALAAGTIVSFTVNNSSVSNSGNENWIVFHESAGTLGAYTVTFTPTGSTTASIAVRNNTAGSLSEAIVIGFIKIGG